MDYRMNFSTEELMGILKSLRTILYTTKWEGKVFSTGESRSKVTLVISGDPKEFVEWFVRSGYSNDNFYTESSVRDLEINFRHLRMVVRGLRGGSLENDAMSVGITACSLYRNIANGVILDPTGNGISDLRDKVIRVSTDGGTDEWKLNYALDRSPILGIKLFRFYAEHPGWKFDNSTLLSLQDRACQLILIPMGDLTEEFIRIIKSPRWVEALDYMFSTEVIDYIIPELGYLRDTIIKTPAGDSTVWDHTIRVMESLRSDSPVARLGALFHDIGKADCQEVTPGGEITFPGHPSEGEKMIKACLGTWIRIPEKTVRRVEFIVRNHEAFSHLPDIIERGKDIDSAIRKLQYDSGGDINLYYDTLAVIDANNRVNGRSASQVELIQKYTEMMEYEETEMFSYQLPLTDTDIGTVCEIKDTGDIRRLREFLLRVAYSNPGTTKAEMIDLLNHIVYE